MVRTQLYLPEDLYESLKMKAKAKKMTFASYVRIYLEREVMEEQDEQKDIRKKYPFLKYAGAFKCGKKSSENENIDNSIYNFS